METRKIIIDYHFHEIEVTFDLKNEIWGNVWKIDLYNDMPCLIYKNKKRQIYFENKQQREDFIEIANDYLIEIMEEEFEANQEIEKTEKMLMYI